MLVILNDRDPRPIYRQIVDEVRRAIVIGSLSRNDPLPSTRQLAVDLRLNPNTVRQAYRELEHEGLVYIRRGQGTFVAATEGEAVERQRLLVEVARRALTDARRHGFEVSSLVEAIAEVSRGTSDQGSTAATARVPKGDTE